MTIPTLITKYQERVVVTKLKKSYSILANAFKLAEYENGSVQSWIKSDDIAENSKLFYEKLKPYIKVIKDCGFEKGCWPSGYLKTLDGQDYVIYDEKTNEYRFILADGTLCMIWISPNSYAGTIGNIKVDVDGFNGDYTFGKDVFIFQITSKGIIPEGLEGEDNINSFEDKCNINKAIFDNGIGCTAWVIYHGNLDYLHCREKLSWNGAHSCKD